MAENPDRYIIHGKTDTFEDHPPKLFPLDGASQNMTKEQTKQWCLDRLKSQSVEEMQAEYSMNQKILMKLDPRYESQPFSE